MPFGHEELGASVFVHRHGAEEVCRSRATLSTHEYAVLGLVTDGSMVIEQAGRWEVGPGDVHLVPPGAPHRRLATRKADVRYVGFFVPAMGCDTDVVRAPFDGVRRGASAVVSIPTTRQELMLTLFAELERAVAEPGRDSMAAQRSLVTLLVNEVMRADRFAPTTDVADDLVASALTIIEQRCLEPLTLRDVARAIHRSPAHVTTTLKRATGRTVVEWIIAGRLAEARRRLVHSDENVDVIAERVGYADPTHFIRLFRREHGATPSAWRARIRAKRAKAPSRA
jgi:AraC-like DNA-binding protein